MSVAAVTKMLIAGFAVIIINVLATTTHDLNYSSVGHDYSCYHKYTWLENLDAHYNVVFDAYSGIMKSQFLNSSTTASASSAASVITFSSPTFNAQESITSFQIIVREVWSGLSKFLASKDSISTFLSKSGVLHSQQHLRSTDSVGAKAGRKLQGPPSGPPPPNGGGSGAPPAGSGSSGGEPGASFEFLSMGWKVTYTGIPAYGHTMTTAEITSLNSRTNKATDFKSNSATTAVAGTYYEFGADLNFDSSSCTIGYWPTGPGCPSNYSGVAIFDLEPAPEGTPGGCYTGGSIGVLAGGTGAWSWSDAQTYNSEGVWHRLAMVFEENDMDICVGHAAQNVYHHHSYSPCLASLLNDTGDGHSPIYGFAFDSYPIFGPYQAKDSLAVSCWQARDYSASSPTGCSDGLRSCMLTNNEDYTQGTTNVSIAGPSLSGTLTGSASVPVSAASGIFYEDYFYNASCFSQGGVYLNKHNGHDHDGLGFHYHMTIDSNAKPVFPYITGPKFYGCKRGGGCSSSIDTDSASTSSICDTSRAVNSTEQQCLNYVFHSAALTSTSSSDSTTSSGGADSGLSSVDTVIIGAVVGGGGGVLLLGIAVYFFFFKGTAAVVSP